MDNVLRKIFGFGLLFCVCSTYATIETHFQQIKSDPAALYTFFKAMPKGGELHYHLTGGAYAEHLITLAEKKHYCIDSVTYATYTPPCTASSINNFHQPNVYHKIIEAWSLKNFTPNNETSHDHFFATFFKFNALASKENIALLIETMSRAASQHETYMEIMFTPDQSYSKTFGPSLEKFKTNEEKYNYLMSDSSFQQNIENTITSSTNLLESARTQLGCNKKVKPVACRLKVKFIYNVLREQPLNNLFAQTLNAFVSASKSTDLIGVNLVQAEDGPISLRDYQAQMQIFNYMHRLFPKVHISLHAGELEPGTLAPEHLKFHIHDAIFTGKAERIGHGSDILHEKHKNKLLTHMAKKHIPVEINLTSNLAILNLESEDHPLQSYLDHHVPVVLSTDDEGILRTNLSHEYVRAVIDQKLDYPTIKNINRNSLTYSFLPGKSIWKNAAEGTPVEACRLLDSLGCIAFIRDNPKANLQWHLEKKLLAFERKF